MEDSKLLAITDSSLKIGNPTPNHNISFHNGTGVVGTLDFNGPELVFTGNAEESARIFIDWIALSFSERLAKERENQRERCAEMVDHILKEGGGTYGDAIRKLR